MATAQHIELKEVSLHLIDPQPLAAQDDHQPEGPRGPTG